MIEPAWGKEAIKNPVDLVDYIEFCIAFLGDVYERFTYANFVDIIGDDISSGDDEHSRSENDDEYARHFDDAMRLVRRRADWLPISYPFSCASGEIRLTDQPRKSHLLYLFLLICSHHHQLACRWTQKLPDQFEIVCKKAMQSLFPDWAEVFLFSKTSKDRKEIFGSSAREAIPALAKKLNAKLLSKKEDLPTTQSEYGIDIIAICPFCDRASHPFFAFAQCTIAKEWWKKKHEARGRSGLFALIHMLASEHTAFLFIPHFARKISGEWNHTDDKTVDCILCDRLRICRLFEKAKFFETDCPPEDDLGEIFRGIENLRWSEHEEDRPTLSA